MSTPVSYPEKRRSPATDPDPSPAAETILEARGLVKTYSRRRVVDGVDFEVYEGEDVQSRAFLWSGVSMEWSSTKKALGNVPKGFSLLVCPHPRENPSGRGH